MKTQSTQFNRSAEWKFDLFTVKLLLYVFIVL